MQPEGPQKQENVGDHFVIKQDPATNTGHLFHIPSGTLMKRWVDPFNSPLAFEYLKCYAENVSKMSLDWSDEEFGNLLPFADFEEIHLDPVGFGEVDAADMTAAVMERLMKYQNQLGGK